MTTQQQITNYIRAGYAGLFVQTYEERRALLSISEAVKAVPGDPFRVYIWSLTQGLQPGGDDESRDPLGMMKLAMGLPERSVVIALDYHQFLGESNPAITRSLKDVLFAYEASNRHFIVLGCKFAMPAELEKHFTLVEFKLPTREELDPIVVTLAKEAGIELNGNRDTILDAGVGLTTVEFINAGALAIIEADKKDIPPQIIAREKSATVKKNGILEIVEPKVTLDDIGGLEFIKADLWAMRACFTKKAREYGIPSPRPLLAVGQAGTGKSLMAMATGSIFNVPLLKLEAGRLFGSLVGESEANWRKAHATARAIAPCIVWVDEVDGLMAGGESSGKTDSGTTARVIKAILQDIQFNSEGIFFVFTCNDIDNLPDPLIDRCDVWSVDLPHAEERKAIWAVHIAKNKRKPKKFDLIELAKITEGFSGRQIEQVWAKAMQRAFNADREPTNDDCLKVAGSFVPTSVTMKEAIEKRRSRLRNRARPASKPDSKETSEARKLA